MKMRKINQGSGIEYKDFFDICRAEMGRTAIAYAFILGRMHYRLSKKHGDKLDDELSREYARRFEKHFSGVSESEEIRDLTESKRRRKNE